MDEAFDFRLYAMECITWAEDTSSDVLREQLRKLAAEWMKAATLVERRPAERHRPRSTMH